MPIPFRLQQQPYIVPKCRQSLRVLYADEHIIVVDKPSGLLSVPGKDPRNFDSVYTRIVAALNDNVFSHRVLDRRILSNHGDADSAQALSIDIADTAKVQNQGESVIGGGHGYGHGKVWMVHRLDCDTSGLMVLAFSSSAAGHLGKQFESRTVSKYYFATVAGLLKADSGSVDLPIICDWPNRPLQKICHTTGKPSLTHYTVIHRDKALQQTSLKLQPHTGRSHQLRIHMRELGHPILGCNMYSPDDVCYAADRLLLHAGELQFKHPATQDVMSFSVAPDFA